MALLQNELKRTTATFRPPPSPINSPPLQISSVLEYFPSLKMNNNNNSAESSGSSQTPPPSDANPRRRSGSGGNTSNASPRGRGTTPRHSWEPHLFNLPRPTVPPVMGVPGRTAFRPYRPPPPPPPPPPAPLSLWQPSGVPSAFRPYSYRPPAPLWPGAGPSGSSRGGLGFQGGPGVVPVGGSGAVTAGPLRIGGSPLTGRKRAREGGAGAGGGGGKRVGDVGGGPHKCSVCNKEFGSSRALFGHMRSHPNRGWKGAHPPPSFKADEEFADLRAGTSAAAEAEPPVEEGEGDAGEGTSYRVPDLNHPPPPDAP